MFDKILNWKLLGGSHEFPGPDGGTCITEAAIVAAGFKYRAIASSADCPSCFSRPITAFTISLNDAMPDDLRQELLMPFVTRLAGTKDLPKIEMARAELIVFRTIRDVMSIALWATGFQRYATRCVFAEDFKTAVATFTGEPAYMAVVENRITEQAARRLVTAAVVSLERQHSVVAVGKAAEAIIEVANSLSRMNLPYDVRRHVFTIAVSILDEAIQLGKQAKPIEVETIIARMNAAKQDWFTLQAALPDGSGVSHAAIP